MGIGALLLLFQDPNPPQLNKSMFQSKGLIIFHVSSLAGKAEIFLCKVIIFGDPGGSVG